MCTIAGLVLFGIKPRRYLRQAGIRVMVFEGKHTIVEDGLVEKLLSVLRPFIFYESNELAKDSLRLDRGGHIR